MKEENNGGSEEVGFTILLDAASFIVVLRPKNFYSRNWILQTRYSGKIATLKRSGC